MSKQSNALNFIDSLITHKSSKNLLSVAPILFSRGKKINRFFTEDSGLYITPHQEKLIKKGKRINYGIKQWDSLSARIIDDYKFYTGRNSFLWRQWQKRKLLQEQWKEAKKSLIDYLTPPRFWNATVIGAILLGMFSMNLIYKYLGPITSANVVHSGDNSKAITLKNRDYYSLKLPHTSKKRKPQVLGINDEVIDLNKEDELNKEEFLNEITNYLEKQEKKELEKKIRQMVKGYPIEKMLPYIMTKDRTTIAFLIGIAKKESNWGKRVPVLKGADCYNYWGYRGKRRLMGSGGHTCFNSRKDAVDTVAKRIKYLAEKQKRNTPGKMVIWKCGNKCYTHNPQSVRKWISDVSLYFNQLNHD